MANEFFNADGAPSPHSTGASVTIRNEFANIALAFDKMPAMAANGLKLLRVNAGGSAIESVSLAALDLLTATTAASTYLPLTGGTLTGPGNLTVAGTITANGSLVHGTTGYLQLGVAGEWRLFAQTGAKLTLGANSIAGPGNGIEIATNGNVGVGASAAGQRLLVYKAGAQATFAVAADPAQTAAIQIGGNAAALGASSFDLVSDGGQTAYVFQRANGALIFGTNNAERMRFTAAGLVGIAKTPTTYAFEVNGDVQAANFRGELVGNSATTSQRTFTNVRTDGLNRGSYGSISIAGSSTGYSGIDFTAASATLMIANDQTAFGVYKNNTTWVFYFNATGALTVGTVPWTSVTSRPTAVSAFTNDSGYYASGSSPSFATVSASSVQASGLLYGNGGTKGWGSITTTTVTGTPVGGASGDFVFVY